MSDIKINREQRVYDFPEMAIEGFGANIMLVVPISALPEHVPSILMSLYEAARTIEQDGRMLSFTLRIIDDSGNIIKETKKITIPRIEYKGSNQIIPDHYGFGKECRTSESKICYDVHGIQKIVFDVLEGAREAKAGDSRWSLPPNDLIGGGNDRLYTTVPSSPLEFPQEIMADFNSLPADEQSAAKESYGLLTVLFKPADLKDIDMERTPPGGLLIVELPAGKAKYPSQVRGVGLGALGTKLLNTFSAPTPCEEIQRLNRLLATVQDNNGGTKLLNDARRFIEDSLVFQMASKSGECSLNGANDGLDALRGNCGNSVPCRDSIKDGLALYDWETVTMPAPEDMIGNVAAYYEIMSELSRKDRNAAIESVRVALEHAEKETYLAYHHYLTQMDVTVPEAFKAILKDQGTSPPDVIKFFEPVLENFKNLEPGEKIKALTLLREDMIRFVRQDNSSEKWRMIEQFICGLFVALNGDAPARSYLAEAVIDSLCMINKDKYDSGKGPDKITLVLFFAALFGSESGEHLKNNPQQTARLFKWVAGLTSVYAIKKANDKPELMLILWGALRQDDKDALVEVAAKSVAEQILTVYLNMESFYFYDRQEKLGIGAPDGSFPDWEKMLGVEGLAAVAVAIANNEKTGDALSITLLPVIEAALRGSDGQEDRLYFVERLMKESNQPHITAALVLNCFRNLDDRTWRWTEKERLQLVRLISKVIDERASFLEDVPIIGPLANAEASKHVRQIFKALASDDVERLLRRTLRQKDGLVGNSSFLTRIPMGVIPMVAVDKDSKIKRPIDLEYDNNPSALTRVSYSFGTKTWSEYPNMWDFWLDIPPTKNFFAGTVKASHRLAERSDVDLLGIMFLLDFISKPSNNVFYDDAMLGDFLEEKIVGSLSELDEDEKIAVWTINAASLVKLMPLERRLRVFKAISADYVTAAKKASNGLSLGPISNVMGQAALGMNSLEELELVLPIIKLVGNKLNTDIPSDDAGFIGIITGMANVIGMLDEEKQLEIIGKVFDECMIALQEDALKLFDRLFEPKDGETKHTDDFPRRVGKRLARSKATNYAHLFLGRYAGPKVMPCEERFDHAQEMALGAVEAYMGKDATITARDLQKVIFTISNNIIFEGTLNTKFIIDRYSSWCASLGEIGSSNLLFVGIRPLVQLIQSAGLPSLRKNKIQGIIKIVVPDLGKIVEALVKSDKLTPSSRMALANRFMQFATSCIDEGWNPDLLAQCKQIQAMCQSTLTTGHAFEN